VAKRRDVVQSPAFTFQFQFEFGKSGDSRRSSRVRVGVSMIFEINIKKSITASILISTISSVLRGWMETIFSIINEKIPLYPLY
jgi:hypothetical protein